MGNEGSKNGKQEDVLKRSDGFLKKFSKLIEPLEHKLTYSEYVSMLSDLIDGEVIKEQRKSGQTFYGGMVELSVNKPEGRVEFMADFYYKSKDGGWEKETRKGCTRLTKFNSEDRETLDFLNSNETIKMAIDPP